MKRELIMTGLAPAIGDRTGATIRATTGALTAEIQTTEVARLEERHWQTCWASYEA